MEHNEIIISRFQRIVRKKLFKMKELKNKFMRLNKYLTLVSINYYELNKLKLLVDDKKVLKKMELFLITQ